MRYSDIISVYTTGCFVVQTVWSCIGGNPTSNLIRKVYDCADVQNSGLPIIANNPQVRIPGCTGANCEKLVYCDFDTDGGGWTVIQMRNSPLQSFFQPWDDYKFGFGTIGQSFWLGNDYISTITQRTAYELHVRVVTVAGEIIDTKYSRFALAPEADNYRLTLGLAVTNPSGTDNLVTARNRPFGTFDRDTDNDPSVRCGAYWHSGWWFESQCEVQSDLNVPYNMLDTRQPHLTGIRWVTTNGVTTLRETKMMIRPINFVPERVLRRRI